MPRISHSLHTNFGTHTLCVYATMERNGNHANRYEIQYQKNTVVKLLQPGAVWCAFSAHRYVRNYRNALQT